jgi:kynureninase
MPGIAAKARELTSLGVNLADSWLANLGFRIGSPIEPAARGAHLALHQPEAWPICRALIERAGVVADFRQPDILRLGFALTTRFSDVWDGLDRVRRLVAAGDHLDVPAGRGRVT